MTDLAQVIADAREEAQVLRRAGNAGQADYVDALLSRVRESAEDFMTWLSEADAMLKSGLSERTLRRRFRDCLDCGTARYGPKRQREYLAAVIPNRPDVATERARGRKAA